MNSFSEIDLSSSIARAIADLGFKTPSEIQKKSLPILLGERTDFIGLAATGTGKTAAFGIPLLENIDITQKKVQALVLCPTRELAVQVAGQLNLIGKHKGVHAQAIYGGASYDEQLRGLKRGAAIVVGTPGRLIEHIERKTVSLADVRTVVLDEADEMISMGFKEDLEIILKNTPRDNSNIWLFSATMSHDVRKVADSYLRKPQRAEVNSKAMLSTTVEQIFYPTRESDKPEILCKIIEMADDFYGIVFCQTKALVIDLTQYLMNHGYKVDCLHGDKDQNSRERTMQAFRDRKVKLLVCTDVASRGLDVKDITHVVNYSIPRELDVYVHRIGRTARSGKSGVAVSLVTPSHRGLIGRIEHMTKSKVREGKIPSRRDIGERKVARMLSEFLEQKGHERVAELLNLEWIEAISEMSGEEIVARFIAMKMPDIFVDRERQKPLLRAPPPPRGQQQHKSHKGGRHESGHGGRHENNRRWNKKRQHAQAGKSEW